MVLMKLIGIILAATAAVCMVAYAWYRRDIRAIRAEVESGSKIAATSLGPIEYAEAGKGEPMLIVHGAGGGYDQGLLIGRDVGDGFRLIAPSRFGYLRTPAPEDASPAAQADAYVALLDHLGVQECVVVGVSAGAPGAIELALRHPERVFALILLVPRTYDPTQAIGVDKAFQSRMVLRLVESSADFLLWFAMRFAGASVIRFLGVRPEVVANAGHEEHARITKFMRSILPLSSRVRGIAIDSSTEISSWPLEQIRVPVLIVSAKDDLFNTLPGARFTAEHIPGAKLRILERGGHLMVGQGEQVRDWMTKFLSQGTVAVHKISSLEGKAHAAAEFSQLI
jgi:pimeloyl-ACP methyl ester carboxylesterase